MKINIISQPNLKGQVVIPKSIRNKLGITSKTLLNISLTGKTITLQPIHQVAPTTDSQDSYKAILKKTQGSWGKVDDSGQTQERRKVELQASRERKKSW